MLGQDSEVGLAVAVGVTGDNAVAARNRRFQFTLGVGKSVVADKVEGLIAAGPDMQLVVASPAIQPVVASPAIQPVVAGPARQRIFSTTAIELVAAVAAVEQVGARSPPLKVPLEP